MKVEGYLFIGCAAFFAAVDVVYWFWSKDPTGSTALGLSVGLAFLLGFFILFTGRRTEPRPEDDPEGEVGDGAGDYGFYSPHSWWPFFAAASAAITTLGIVIGWWLFFVGILCVFLAAIGFVFEYYRGHFSH